MSDRATGQHRWIRPLPKQLINKIAAGEVVERPSAVVKELVENSLDADSTRIDIEVEKSGTKLIKIVDNGCGIESEQIEIAFSRHATSKISNFADLEALFSYGFRGEALPSIASVSQLRMVSRPADAEMGTEVVYEGGVLQSVKPVASPPGTTLEVRNLFFNTPARRKFLKSDSAESRYLSRTAMAMAMSRPDVAFSYTSGGRQIFGAPERQSLDGRVRELLGSSKEYVEFAGPAGPVEVKGCIGTPQHAQQNRFGLYVFINGRWVHSPSLMHAVISGYGELLPRGNYPIGGVQITIDPAQVDVNVHPSKTEVRLSHEREIHDGLRHLVRRAMHSEGTIPTYRTPSPARPAHLPDQREGGQKLSFRLGAESRGDGRIPGPTSPDYDPKAFARLHEDLPEASTPTGERVDTRTGEIISELPGETRGDGRSHEEVAPKGGFRLIGRFGDLYLLLQRGDDLYIVDQHTAHERVLYEENIKRLEQQSIHAQQLLFPAQVELSPEQLAVYEEIGETLQDSGFDIGFFGGRMINIQAVPSVLTRRSPEVVVQKVLDDIASLRQAGYDLKKAIAQSMACRAAVMAGDRLSDEQAVGLLERLLQCENAFSCPHGRPTFVRLTRSDIDKQFGRG
ncbi:DNA mismatch repair endonuclease MutL [candidate division GN15 bacterium]|nr:DNA mismatch repair endonuclease MutL [candidate division GN15 bacterium]